MKKEKVFKILYFLTFSCFVTYLILEGIDKENEISENYSFTYGKIYRKNKNWTRRNCSSDYYYEFTFNQKSYKGKDCGPNYFFASEKYFCKIEFSKVNPNKNRMKFHDLYKMKIIYNKHGKIKDTIFETLTENSELFEKRN